MADEDGPARAHNLATGGNMLLAGVSASDLAYLAVRGSRRTYGRGEVLHRAGEPADGAHFVERGVASVVKVDGERRTEVCLIGPEGFTGAAIVQADGRSPYETFVQADMLASFHIGARELRAVIAEKPGFGAALLNAIHVQTVQIAENLVSAITQRVAVRLARWLLMYHDRMDSCRLEVTHEFMAIMVGTQRTKVTDALHDLEAAGAIIATRGCVMIADASLLERLSDGTYGTAEREARRLRAAPPRC